MSWIYGLFIRKLLNRREFALVGATGSAAESNQFGDSTPSASLFQVSVVVVPRVGVRHVLTERQTFLPKPAASLYEAHLALKTDSHNTRARELGTFASLYAWAVASRTDLDRLLLTGQGFTAPQVRAFAAWVRRPHAQANGVIPLVKRKSINAVLQSASVICRWFIKQFSSLESFSPSRRAIEVEMLLAAQKSAWKDVLIKVRKESTAPDLTDQEVAAIEQFLRPENRSKTVGESIAWRDYLMWRMAIELGVRKSEILAMRLCDCPTRVAPYFKVVRIEERGDEYVDPRRNPPRPKTLSRDLGFLLNHTVFPRLVSDYVSTYRYAPVKVRGRLQKKFVLPHDFLITAESGEPLSLRAADDVAKAIQQGTGVDFNWHLARHAFFNRAYEAVSDADGKEAREARIADLIYWGGWENPKSIEIYTKRARAQRAREALMVWQKGGNRWTALV
jgi:integrase